MAGNAARERRALTLAILVAAPLTILHGLSESDRVYGDADVTKTIDRNVLDAGYLARRWIHPAGRVSPEIVVVTWDDYTMAHIEQDPSNGSGWEFDSRILNALRDAKARVVFFDFIFRVGSRTYGDRLDLFAERLSGGAKLTAEQAAQLKEIRASLDLDTLLADAIAGVPTILPFSCVANDNIPRSQTRNDEDLDREMLGRGGAFEAPPGSIRGNIVKRFSYPFPRFARAAVELAQTCETYDSDRDHVVRTDPAVLETWRGDKRLLVPSVAVVLARWAQGLPKSALEVDASSVSVGSLRIPLQPDGTALLQYAGPAGDFEGRAQQGTPVAYHAWDVAAGAVPSARFKDKVVLFGVTYTGNTDRKATPFSRFGAGGEIPGVIKIATQLDGILRTPGALRRPHWASRFGFLLTALAGIAAAAFSASIPIRRVPVLALVFLGPPLVILASGILLFAIAGLWIDAGTPALNALVVAAVGAGYRYSKDVKERQFLEQAFGKYLSPDMVKGLVAGGEGELRLQGKSAELSMLFADLRGFTSKSELISSEEMVKLLNEHLTAMSEVILRHGGTLDKFIGDCVMAFWGAPVADSEHAFHACEAAVEMLEVLSTENAKRRATGRLELDIGVGVASGPVTVGNMGSIHRFDYTVIGDAVNTASRLEGLTKDVGYGCVIGERTVELVKGRIPIDPLGTMKVKGKAVPVPIFGLSATRRADPTNKTA